MASPEQQPEQQPSEQPSATQPDPSPEELLALALESLSTVDRQRVTVWLLTKAPTRPPSGWLGHQERTDLLHTLLPTSQQSFMELYAHNLRRGGLGAALGAAGLGAGQENQVVPVRLPAELHARLRTWSSENGFSMATVVRGLVARFLDSQASPEVAPET